jgi:hypothetical protein
MRGGEEERQGERKSVKCENNFKEEKIKNLKEEATFQKNLHRHSNRRKHSRV